jgi:hypothetical protein
MVGQPLIFAFTAAGALGALAIRGLPLALLMAARLAVTGFGLSAGLALSNQRPGAVRLAIAALGLSAASDVFTLSTSIWPNNRMPGDTPFYIAGVLAFDAGWILYLLGSRRVRRTFE